MKFAEEGCAIVIADVFEAEARRTLEEIAKEGGEGIVVKCDVSDIRQVDEMVSKTISQLGKVDILVNCAGVALVMKPSHDFIHGQ